MNRIHVQHLLEPTPQGYSANDSVRFYIHLQYIGKWSLSNHENAESVREDTDTHSPAVLLAICHGVPPSANC